MFLTTIMLWGIILFLILCFALVIGLIVWIANDAKRHNQSALLWVLICLVSTPIFGLILYLALGRKVLVDCPNCGQKMEQSARFCPTCGAPAAETKPMQPASARGPIVAVVLLVALVVISVLFVGVSIFAYANNTSTHHQMVAAITQPSIPMQSTFYVNSGWQTIGSQSRKDGIWTISFADTSDGYTWASSFAMDDAPRTLYVESEFGGDSVAVTLTQGDVSSTTALYAHDTNSEIPLDDFSAGDVQITVTNHGASDASLCFWIV